MVTDLREIAEQLLNEFYAAKGKGWKQPLRVLLVGLLERALRKRDQAWRSFFPAWIEDGSSPLESELDERMAELLKAETKP